MYKHILIPTDGSKLAGKGIKAGVKLARALGARVTGVYVIPPYVPPMYGEGSIYPGVSTQVYRKYTEKQAKKALAAIEIEADTAGVPCATKFLTAPKPSEGIMKAARARKCDLIAMASHGRGGLGGLLLGSETNGVLAHSKIPVVVLR
jgi:nucleotide-binding universal stress UspA family protein